METGTLSIAGTKEQELVKSRERRSSFRFQSESHAAVYCDAVARAAFGSQPFVRSGFEFVPRDEHDSRGWLRTMASATAHYHRLHRGHRKISGMDGLSLRIDGGDGSLIYAYWVPDPAATPGSAEPTVTEAQARELAVRKVHHSLNPDEVRDYVARLGWAAQYDPKTGKGIPSYVLAWQFVHPRFASKLMDNPPWQDPKDDSYHVGSVCVSATGTGEVWLPSSL